MPYNLVAKSISTSNHMFGRVIWDKLPKCIFLNILKLLKENKGNFKFFRNYEGDLSRKLPEPNVITSNQKTLCIETDIF